MDALDELNSEFSLDDDFDLLDVESELAGLSLGPDKGASAVSTPASTEASDETTQEIAQSPPCERKSDTTASEGGDMLLSLSTGDDSPLSLFSSPTKMHEVDNERPLVSVTSEDVASEIDGSAGALGTDGMFVLSPLAMGSGDLLSLGSPQSGAGSADAACMFAMSPPQLAGDARHDDVGEVRAMLFPVSPVKGPAAEPKIISHSSTTTGPPACPETDAVSGRSSVVHQSDSPRSSTASTVSASSCASVESSPKFSSSSPPASSSRHPDAPCPDVIGRAVPTETSSAMLEASAPGRRHRSPRSTRIRRAPRTPGRTPGRSTSSHRLATPSRLATANLSASAMRRGRMNMVAVEGTPSTNYSARRSRRRDPLRRAESASSALEREQDAAAVNRDSGEMGKADSRRETSVPIGAALPSVCKCAAQTKKLKQQNRTLRTRMKHLEEVLHAVKRENERLYTDLREEREKRREAELRAGTLEAEMALIETKKYLEHGLLLERPQEV